MFIVYAAGSNEAGNIYGIGSKNKHWIQMEGKRPTLAKGIRPTQNNTCLKPQEIFIININLCYVLFFYTTKLLHSFHSWKNHSELRCTQMKIILSSVQHTFSVPEKPLYLSWSCKIRTPTISKTSLVTAATGMLFYCCYHI